MIKPISSRTWRIAIIAAIVSAVVFVIMQFLPTLAYETTSQRPISQEKAIATATEFVKEHTGFIVAKAEAYHDSDKDYTGYLSKYKLEEAHKSSIEQYLPIDQYRVNIRTGGADLTFGTVYLNLYTGEIVGWDFTYAKQELVDEQTAHQAIYAELEQRKFPLNEETHIDTYEQVENLDLFSGESRTTTGYYVSNDQLVVKDAVMQIDTGVINYNGSVVVNRMVTEFMLPADYTDMIAKQDFYAKIWTFAVYTVMSFVLGILAIIYAILYRHHTSFKYGVWLTIIASIIGIIVNAGLMKSQLGLEGQMLSDSGFLLIFTIIITIITIILGAVSYYFAFVAGDGLWRAQGFHLWPRFKDANYGKHVWDSMKMGYLTAIIALGVQNVIFLLLTQVLGTWSANDTSQSLLNFEYSWLFPLIAWFAAITEEVIFRLFGVGLFRRWFKNTWIAALIPTLAWAAGHTLYPLYPASTRIVELLIIGYMFTWVMMRFGFITGMFMHAVFNTILISISMYISGTTADIVSASFFLVLPVIIAAVIRWLHGRKKDTKEPIAPPYPPVAPQE